MLIKLKKDMSRPCPHRRLMTRHARLSRHTCSKNGREQHPNVWFLLIVQRMDMSKGDCYTVTLGRLTSKRTDLYVGRHFGSSSSERRKLISSVSFAETACATIVPVASSCASENLSIVTGLQTGFYRVFDEHGAVEKCLPCPLSGWCGVVNTWTRRRKEMCVAEHSHPSTACSADLGIVGCDAHVGRTVGH